MLTVKNTALDRTKTLLHRQAPKMEMEPLINGQRLRLYSSVQITDEWAEKNKKYLEDLIKQGVIELVGSMDEVRLDENGLKLGGPTLEQFMKAGYPADRYPPGGWAEVPSVGLTAYRKEVEDTAAAFLKAKEEAELTAMMLAEEEAAQAALAAKKLELSESLAVSDNLTTESAGTPVADVTPTPSAPAVEDKKDDSKKGPGKSSKLK